jgi:uncharacterized protein (TIGR00369 family)
MNPLRDPSPGMGQTYFIDVFPHNAMLGLRYVESGVGRVVLDLPWRPELVGDPETGVIHGGAITTLFDAACGNAIATGLDELCRLVTLDLRIDYLRPARSGKTVRCEAECTRLTRHIAWARATAHHEDDPQTPIATAIATFMMMRDEGGTHPRAGHPATWKPQA